MIWDALVDLVVGFLLAVIDLFPVIDFGPVAGFGLTIGTALGTANNYFPVGVLGACLGLVFTVRLGMIGWRFVLMIYQNFPGKAT